MTKPRTLVTLELGPEDPSFRATLRLAVRQLGILESRYDVRSEPAAEIAKTRAALRLFVNACRIRHE